MTRLEAARERLDDLVCGLAAHGAAEDWTDEEVKMLLDTLAGQFHAMTPKTRSYMLALAVLELARRQRQRSFAE